MSLNNHKVTALIVTICSYVIVQGQANTSLSNLATPVNINAHLTPLTSNITDVGSTTKSWRHIYAGTSYNLAGARIIHATGSNNFAVGRNALSAISSGSNNTANGIEALNSTNTGSYNTAFGFNSLYSNTSGFSNTAVGYNSLYSNTTGRDNCAIGSYVLHSSTTGYSNTVLGNFGMMLNINGKGNTATGDHSLFYNSGGSYNTASGYDAVRTNSSGSFNTGLGYRSLYENTTGNNNTAVGSSALQYNTTGYNNTAIGYNAGPSASYPSLTNTTALGNEAKPTASNQVMIGNTAVTSVRAAGSFVIYSDGRYKKEIQENVPGLEFIKMLRPVTYHYKVQMLDEKVNGRSSRTEDFSFAANASAKAAMDAKEKKLYTGFVAQEVETAAKQLRYEFSGIHVPENENDIYGLSYSEFVVPLVKAVQQLSNSKDSLEIVNAALLQRIEKIESLLKIAGTPNRLSGAALSQNAPNPFRSHTAVQYVLPQEGTTDAQLLLHDASGKKIKSYTLSANSIRGTFNIDASWLAAGTYHYSLLVNGKIIDTKTMVLAK